MKVLVVLVVLAGPSLAKLRKSSTKFSLFSGNSLFSTDSGNGGQFSSGFHDYSHFPFNPFTQFPELLPTTPAPIVAQSWVQTTLTTTPITIATPTRSPIPTQTQTPIPTPKTTHTPSPSPTPYPTSPQIPTLPVPEAKHTPTQKSAPHRRRDRRPYARELHTRKPLKTTTTTKQTRTTRLTAAPIKATTTTEKSTTTERFSTTIRTTFPTQGSTRSLISYPRTTTSSPKPESRRAVIHYPRTTTFNPEANRSVIQYPRTTTSSPEASRAVIYYPRTPTSSPKASRAVVQYPRTTTIPSSRGTINATTLVEESPRSGGSSFKVSRREEVDNDGTVHGSYSYQAPNGDTVVVRYQAGPRGYRLLSQGDSTADQQTSSGEWRASSRETTTQGPFITMAPILPQWAHQRAQSVPAEAPEFTTQANIVKDQLLNKQPQPLQSRQRNLQSQPLPGQPEQGKIQPTMPSLEPHQERLKPNVPAIQHPEFQHFRPQQQQQHLSQGQELGQSQLALSLFNPTSRPLFTRKQQQQKKNRFMKKQTQRKKTIFLRKQLQQKPQGQVENSVSVQQRIQQEFLAKHSFRLAARRQQQQQKQQQQRPIQPAFLQQSRFQTNF